MDTATDGEDDHAGTAVDGVAGAHEFSPRLERVVDCWLSAGSFTVNAEDAADWDQAVDVGWAIQGIKTDNVFSLKRKEEH